MQAEPDIHISQRIQQPCYGNRGRGRCDPFCQAIDGVYDSDPKTNPNAKKYDTMPISEIVDKKLGVIDLAAAVLAMENKMPMMLFGLNDTNSIEKV